jgi:hypothetical protein
LWDSCCPWLARPAGWPVQSPSTSVRPMQVPCKHGHRHKRRCSWNGDISGLLDSPNDSESRVSTLVLPAAAAAPCLHDAIQGCSVRSTWYVVRNT